MKDGLTLTGHQALLTLMILKYNQENILNAFLKTSIFYFYSVRNIFFILLVVISTSCFCQVDSINVYKMKPTTDALLLLSGAALNTYFLVEEPNKKRFISLDEILSVSREEVPSWEQSATYNWNETAEIWSDYIQGLAMVTPIALMASPKMRKDATIIGLMAAETLILNQGISGALKINTQRKRPFVYNEEAPVELKYRRQVFYSFPSAHTSASAAATFFTAQVFSDYYPDSKWKKWVWIGAAALPAITGYLRYEAGRHFITDIAAGYSLGAALGIIIPRLHKIKSDDINLNVFTPRGSMGLKLVVNLNRQW